MRQQPAPSASQRVAAQLATRLGKEVEGNEVAKDGGRWLTRTTQAVLRTLADDIADGPDAVDLEQLELAIELIRDVGDYAEDNIVEEALNQDQPLGRFVGHALSPDKVRKPAAPYAKAVEQWEKVETFVESRLREE